MRLARPYFKGIGAERAGGSFFPNNISGYPTRGEATTLLSLSLVGGKVPALRKVREVWGTQGYGRLTYANSLLRSYSVIHLPKAELVPVNADCTCFSCR